MQKQDRQKFILDLITAKRVERQSDIVRALNAAGYGVTQASVSRDLEEIGIVKTNGAYARRSEALTGLAMPPVDLHAVGENLIVVRCPSGLASAFAVRIDAAGEPNIVGTIAGDDTIFLAVQNPEAQVRVMSFLKELFQAQ